MSDKISKLNIMVDVQIPIATTGELGEVINTWGDTKSLWANNKPFAADVGFEETLNQKEQAQQKTEFEFRYDRDLIDSHHFSAISRVLYNGFVYDIYAVELIGMNDRIALFGKASINPASFTGDFILTESYDQVLIETGDNLVV